MKPAIYSARSKIEDEDEFDKLRDALPPSFLGLLTPCFVIVVECSSRAIEDEKRA